MSSTPDLIQVRFLQALSRGGFHAAEGEVRTMHRVEGEAAIAKGEAELVQPKAANPKPARKR